MKKILLLVILMVILLCSCNKIDNQIDLSTLKNNNDAFCYDKLTLNSNLQQVKNILGSNLELKSSVQNKNASIYAVNNDYQLYECKGMLDLHFEDDKLKIIRFTFDFEDDNLDEMYDKLIKELKELYSEENETINNESRTKVGEMKMQGYRWDLEGDITTSLQTVKIEYKGKTSVMLTVGVLEKDQS